MILEVIGLQDVLDYLNDLLRYDREAVERLIDQRVVCNNKMADHPCVQVQAKGKDNQDVTDASEEVCTVEHNPKWREGWSRTNSCVL